MCDVGAPKKSEEAEIMSIIWNSFTIEAGLDVNVKGIKGR